jgi:hypothetical protein
MSRTPDQTALPPCPFCGCWESSLIHYPEDADTRPQRQCDQCLATGPHEDGPDGLNPAWGWSMRNLPAVPPASIGLAALQPATRTALAKQTEKLAEALEFVVGFIKTLPENCMGTAEAEMDSGPVHWPIRDEWLDKTKHAPTAYNEIKKVETP